MARKVPEINSTSTADIAFMLLIFFLVTTTMDVDSGLARKLPPFQENPPENDDVVRERDVFVVLINKSNQLMVEGQPMQVNLLRDAVKEFITNPREKENLSDKKMKENIPFFGNRMVSKGIVSLQNDRGTDFGKYIEVQNEIVAAFNELKEELSQQKWRVCYDDLPEDKQNAIRLIYPLSISEAEPRNIGG